MFSSWKSQEKQPQKAKQITYSVLYRTYIRLHKMVNLLWTSEFLGQIIGMRPKKVFHFSGETSWWETYLMFTFVTWKARFSSKVGSSLNKGNFKSWLTFQIPRMDWLKVFLQIKILICATLIISWGTSREFIPFIILEGNNESISEISYLGKLVYGKRSIVLTVNLWKFVCFDGRSKVA